MTSDVCRPGLDLVAGKAESRAEFLDHPVPQQVI